VRLWIRLGATILQAGYERVTELLNVNEFLTIAR
jgi:hypothetical protein